MSARARVVQRRLQPPVFQRRLQRRWVAAGLDAMLRSPQITAHEDRRAQVVNRSHEYEPRGQAQQQISSGAHKVKEA